MKKETGMRIALIVCFAVAFSYESIAMDSDGSNLGRSGYPEHSCGKKPVEPSTMTHRKDPGDWGRDPEMRIEFEEMEYAGYEGLLSFYVDCINEYIDNANNDIKRIHEAISAASDEASN